MTYIRIYIYKHAKVPQSNIQGQSHAMVASSVVWHQQVIVAKFAIAPRKEQVNIWRGRAKKQVFRAREDVPHLSCYRNPDGQPKRHGDPRQIPHFKGRVFPNPGN